MAKNSSKIFSENIEKYLPNNLERKNNMKIIDLLNKIANNEEVPKKIKYEDDIYIHVDNYCYFCEETNEILSQNIYAEFSRLNDEVEVIEDNKKIEKNDEELPQNTFEMYGYVMGKIVDNINKGWDKAFKKEEVLNDKD